MVTLALAYDIDAIAEKAGLLPDGLAEAAAEQQRALHLDHRLPGAQGQPQGHQGLGRPGEAGRRRSSRPIRRPRAARAGTTWRPGATRCKQPGGDEAKAKDFVAELLQERARCSTPARAARRPPSSSAASATCCWPGRTRRSWRSRSSGTDKFEIVVPSLSILAEPPVAVVDKVVDKQGHAGGGRGLPRVPLHARGPGDRGQALLPAARSRRWPRSTRPASRRSSCSPSTRSSAAGRRRRRRTSPTAASSTRSISPGDGRR